MSKYPKHCVTNKSSIFKQNPSMEMSLNFEVNSLTIKNNKKIELFQTKLKFYKLICLNIIPFVHITIYLHINSKNPWLSYAKIQEILMVCQHLPRYSTFVVFIVESLLGHGMGGCRGPVEIYVLL